MAKKYYAVANGRSTGVFTDWNSAKSCVTGFSNASYKGFNNLADAQSFANSRPSGSGLASKSASKGGSSYSSNLGSGYTRSLGNIGPSSSHGRSGSGSHRLTKASSSKRQEVYVDGAARGNGYAGLKAGYGVYWGENDPRNEHNKLSGSEQTNQRAELTAIKRATDRMLSEVKEGEPKHYEVKTDSQYSRKAITEWSKKWEQNGWKTSQGTPVANADIIKPILSNIKQIKKLSGQVTITHVKGHSGIHGNEMADQLANKGADLHDH